MKATEGKERMVKADNSAKDEELIRRLIYDRQDSLRKKDVERTVSQYAKDFVLFDLAPPLRTVNSELSRNLEEWFSTFQGPINIDIRDLDIAVAGDVAFAHCINHLTGTRTNGDETDVWIRVTVGFRKIDGNWLVTHEHVSVPFYMDGSYRAAIDLKP